MKASTTICRLVLSFLSQFFQSRRHFSSQANDRSTTHRFGSTTKVCSSFAFHHFHRGPQQALHRSGKGLPGITPVDQHLLDLAEVGPVLVKHRQSPSPVGNIGGSHVYPMGQSLRVHRDMTLDSGHLLACVIALVPGGVRVLDALGVHDAEAGLLFPSIALPGRVANFGGDGMVVLVGVSFAYLGWYMLVGCAVGFASVLVFRRSAFRSSVGIFLGFGTMLAFNTVRGIDWSVMLGLTALAMVVITHNILTNADHVPTAETTMQIGELLIEDTPAILQRS